jgi:hypothetical protein
MIGKRLLSALIALLRALLLSMVLTLLCYLLFVDTMTKLDNSGYVVLVFILYVFLSIIFLMFYIGIIMVPYSFICKKTFEKNDTLKTIETCLPLTTIGFLLTSWLVLIMFRYDFGDALFALIIAGILQYSAMVQFVLVVKNREYTVNKGTHE